MKKEFKFFLNGEYPKEIVKTDKYWLTFKDESEPYLDLQLGYSAFILGYNRREIFENVLEDYDVQFARGVTAESNNHIERLKNRLFDIGNWSGIAWATSGSDAVESAYEINRHYWNKIDPRKTQILVFRPNYHGTTLLGKHLRGEMSEMNLCRYLPVQKWETPQQREDVENSLISKIDSFFDSNSESTIGAIMMESIPWIDYLQPWSKEFWLAVRNISDRYKINLIVDDVAGCFGKGGHYFSNDFAGVQPDIVSIGKAFTAGYAPLAATLCNNKISEVISISRWTHTHTYYPSMYGVIIANNTIDYLEKHDLFSNISVVNKKLKDIGQKHNLSVIGDHLMVSFSFKKSLSITDIFSTRSSVCLPFTGYNDTALKVCAPINSDEEYFYHLEKRISKFL